MSENTIDGKPLKDYKNYIVYVTDEKDDKCILSHVSADYGFTVTAIADLMASMEEANKGCLEDMKIDINNIISKKLKE